MSSRRCLWIFCTRCEIYLWPMKSAKPGAVSLSRFSDIFHHQTYSRSVASRSLFVNFSCLAALYSCGRHPIAWFPKSRLAQKICPSQRGLICSSALLIAMYVIYHMLNYSASNSKRAIQSCGAKPVAKILFSLRRRACKSCMRVQ